MEKDEKRSDNDLSLTPRHALICAAVTGWKGDSPSPWSWPVACEDIVAWAKSYEQSHNEAIFGQAFEQLVKDGLFLPICYPIFAKPYFSCWYESSFLEELPTEIQFPGWSDENTFSLVDIIEFWDDWFARLVGQYGPAYVKWGVCAGQGSEGPSDIPSGPCLGPSCCCYSNGNRDSCHHGLEFVHIAAEKMPDMGFLHYLNWSNLQDDKAESAVNDAILKLKALTPDLS